jgi:dipeptidyl aminopeptidase/acylaminoacyl peptidase
MWFAALLVAQAPAGRPAASDDLAASRARLVSEAYVSPPEPIVRLVTAPRHLNFSLTRPSPDRRYFIREVPEVPVVNSFGKPHYYLGGLQVDPAANRARSLTTRGAAQLSLIDATGGRATVIELPAGATVTSPVWAPDGRQIAFIANFDKASHIYLADVATGKSRLLTRTPLLATLVTGIEFTGDGSGIVAVLLPDNRPAEPARPAVAGGPRVQVWMDSLKSPQRTFFSLLEEPHQQALLEYYTTGQLAVIDVKSRAVRKLGAPAMIRSVDPSPDARYFRVTTMQKPFSYVVQYSNFGELEQIWDADGRVLADVVKRPLREAPDTSDDPVARRTDGGKRSLGWLPRGEGLFYLEPIPSARERTDSADTAAARGGAPGGGGTRPDRLVKWLPPFGKGDTAVLYRAEGPIAQLAWNADASTIFVATTRAGTGELYAVRLSEPDKKYSSAALTSPRRSMALPRLVRASAWCGVRSRTRRKLTMA